MYYLDQPRHANWTWALIKCVGPVALWTWCFLVSLINVTTGILYSLFRKYQWIRSRDDRQMRGFIFPCGHIGQVELVEVTAWWNQVGLNHPLPLKGVEDGRWQKPEDGSGPGSIPHREARLEKESMCLCLFTVGERKRLRLTWGMRKGWMFTVINSNTLGYVLMGEWDTYTKRIYREGKEIKDLDCPQK